MKEKIIKWLFGEDATTYDELLKKYQEIHDITEKIYEKQRELDKKERELAKNAKALQEKLERLLTLSEEQVEKVEKIYGDLEKKNLIS